MKFQKEIEDLNFWVNEYYTNGLQDGNELSRILQKITGLLYYLETQRSATHDLYENAVFKLVKGGSSQRKAKRIKGYQ